MLRRVVSIGPRSPRSEGAVLVGVSHVRWDYATERAGPLAINSTDAGIPLEALAEYVAWLWEHDDPGRFSEGLRPAEKERYRPTTRVFAARSPIRALRSPVAAMVTRPTM